MLFGASIHPNRGKDNGLKEINRCIKGGAVLIKWIPNSHMIDPSDEKYEWFYEKLAAEGIPLLCHTGPEHAVPVPGDNYQELGNPLKLKLPLEKGVTVIAAHCSTAYFPGEKSYMPELTQLIDEAQKPENKWNLYADISAMCSLFRISIIKEVLKTIPHERMVMGSDYPIPIDNLPPYIVETLNFKESLKIFKIDNPIEKNYQQLLAMGFPYEAMTRGWDILRKEQNN